MDNLGYLFAAYTIIWAFVFGYVFFLYYKQRKLRQQMDLLKDSIGEQPNKDVAKVNTDDNAG
ncbi:MAG TPA: CcmD family protein [Dehalococcoidia bacterium]|nr:CcmD family protein [Dehalococcoidia bacterium]